MHWCSEPVASLPKVPCVPMQFDDSLPVIPPPAHLHQLITHIDAAHANELRQRHSTTGCGCCLAGGVVACRSRTQSICGQSSTEAELIAASAAAKVTKYLCFILHKLGYTQTEPCWNRKVRCLSIKLRTGIPLHLSIYPWSYTIWSYHELLPQHPPWFMIGETVLLGAFTDQEQLCFDRSSAQRVRINAYESTRTNLHMTFFSSACVRNSNRSVVLLLNLTGDTHGPFSYCIQFKLRVHHCCVAHSSCMCTTIANSMKPGFEPPTSTLMGILHQGFFCNSSSVHWLEHILPCWNRKVK